jgi:ferredoxin
MSDNDQTTEARVDHDTCVGVGMCVLYAPDAFDFNDDAQAEFKPRGDWTEVGLQEAADACPTSSITLVRKSS